MYVLVTPPASEPVTRDEVKVRLEITDADHDDMIDALIAAARQHFERETNRSLVTQTWRLDLDRFPCGAPIVLAHGPVIAVSDVAYIDTDGSSQTLAAEDRIDDVGSERGRIVPLVGEAWPYIDSRPGAVRVTYTAGYGDAGDVPQLAKTCIHMLVGHWYENREAVVVGNAVQSLAVPMAAEAILASYRIPALA